MTSSSLKFGNLPLSSSSLCAEDWCVCIPKFVLSACIQYVYTVQAKGVQYRLSGTLFSVSLSLYCTYFIHGASLLFSYLLSLILETLVYLFSLSRNILSMKNAKINKTRAETQPVGKYLRFIHNSQLNKRQKLCNRGIICWYFRK